MPAIETQTETFEYTIDTHKARCEVRCTHGEWSAYVFIDPVNAAGKHSPDTARQVLPKLLRKLADEVKRRQE